MDTLTETATPSCSTELSSVDFNMLSDAEQEQALQLQQDLLDLVSRGGEATTQINQICKLAEQSLSNAIGSVMLVDEATDLLNVYSAPSVPPEGIDRLNGLQPGPGGGSCGNAVFRKAPQFIEDTFKDPRWENMREIAHDFNICACWSMPIFSAEGNVVGSFALSSFEHRSPSKFHHKLLEIGASVIGNILDRSKIAA